MSETDDFEEDAPLMDCVLIGIGIALFLWVMFIILFGVLFNI